jgi:GWxTD domain-containing protein
LTFAKIEGKLLEEKMWIYILSLFLMTKSVQITSETGTGFDFTFDCANFRESDTSVRIELYLKIPYSTLVFERIDSAFVGQYLATAQVIDQHKEPIAGREWKREIRVNDYNQSKANGYEYDQFNLNLNINQGKNWNGYLKLEDLNSSKNKELNFAIDIPKQLSDVVLKKSSRLNPSHSYGSTDTLEDDWEVYRVSQDDSCSIVLSKDKKIMGKYVFAPTNLQQAGTSLIGQYRALLPFNTYPDLTSGTYNLQVIYNPTGDAKNVEITIASPFYLSTKDYLEKVDELRYIATEPEMKRLRQAAPNDRLKAWEEFWQKKDPTPTTEENEAMVDYFKRIDYCNEHFSKGDRGYKSDRARIYMKYGPPDQIETNPFERSTQPYEIWYYYSPNQQFTFVDLYGFGEYTLVTNQYLR